MRTPQQVSEIIRCLENEYPLADCTLDYGKDYELLFSVRLAAQCTDERVNKVTPALYERFPTLESIAEADVSEIEEYIRSCGFYHSKAKDIAACARVLVEKYGGKVPGTMLAACILLGNTLLLSWMVNGLGVNRFAGKIVTELTFFTLSWLAQKFIIFRKPAGKEGVH